MAGKRERKQLRAVAQEFGMDDEARNDFGRYIEESKAAGDRGAGNARGDFTYDELRAKAREFLGLGE